MRGLGEQWAVDYFDCDRGILNDAELLRQVLVDTIRDANGTIVNETFHRFSPHGISGVVVIAESHVAIHTWPEIGCAAIDIFSCSPSLDSKLIRTQLKLRFGASRVLEHCIERGVGLRGQLLGLKPATAP